MSSYSVSGHIVDILNKKIFSGTVFVDKGKVVSIRKEPVIEDQYILPGFVDAHIHIESSMLVPSEFARLAVLHGTVATVSDPHEIGNVLGIDGIRYMCENSKDLPFHIFYGASPCIPATSFETSGATISPSDIRSLFEQDNLKYLSEMMNFEGVLNEDCDVLKKIEIAKCMNKPIDGHSPGLRGERAKKYVTAGISTDHECITLEEAVEKIQYGMKIIIREGSAAKNYNALHPLLKSYPDKIMFCSDDKHPNELIKGHINDIVRLSLEKGYDLMDVLRAACLHPIQHYGLEVGLLQEGDPADFIIINNLKDFKIKSTYIKGERVAFEGKSLIEPRPIKAINQFDCSLKTEDDLKIRATGNLINVIKVIPGELTTEKLIVEAEIENGNYISIKSKDILKLVVVNRYKNVSPSIAFVKGIGIKEGALASSVAHDSHNIIAVGVDDASLCHAVNAIIESKGGVCVAQNNKVNLLPLPVAGLMSDQDGFKVAEEYEAIKIKSLELGSMLPDPFMTLSFLALLVIPSLKLSDKGLFDVDAFKYISVGVSKSSV